MGDFLTADDVEKICKVKSGKAYQIIKDVNKEMKDKGYLIIRGRVNKRFLFDKLGISDNHACN